MRLFKKDGTGIDMLNEAISLNFENPVKTLHIAGAHIYLDD